MLSASTYYFDSNKKKEGEADLIQSFIYAYQRHYGSIGMGSLIIAFSQFFRMTIGTLSKRASSFTGDNVAVKTLVKCAECTLK